MTETVEMNEFCAFEPVYSEVQRELIDSEFQRIKDEHFLDHAGGTLYSEKQVEIIAANLQRTLLCNPHGRNAPSQRTDDAIDIIRYRILNHFHTDSREYSIIFTSNSTASLKLVAENFQFANRNGEEGVLAYLEDNHTSVLGMRAYSNTSRCIKVQEALQTLQSPRAVDLRDLVNTNSLFVYPAQCNFSGTKYPLDWIRRVQSGHLNGVEGLKSENWYVLLDAANFAGSNDLDLSIYKPDFVTFSFYKMFGYPTGVGALLVRNCRDLLRKKYYGGGTVLMALATENEVVLKSSLSERFEDGSLPYLSINSLNEGFNTFSRLHLNMPLISKHIFNLAKYLYTNLVTLHHANGRAAVILYHDTTFQDSQHQGGIVNFNLVRENGQNIGYAEVMNMASLNKIHLRTGCSCNPGACQRHLKLTSDDVRKHFQAGHVCGDLNDLVEGVPTGSLRVSFGYMSRKEDADAILKMIEDCYVQKPILRKLPANWAELQENYRNKFVMNHTKQSDSNKNGVVRTTLLQEPISVSNSTPNIDTNEKLVKGVLKHIWLYPVKSCGAFVVPKSWRISKSGLEYDRKWMIVNSDGSCLTQKQNPRMCLILPSIDLDQGILVLSGPESSVFIRLHDPYRERLLQYESKICRNRVMGNDCGDRVSNWLSEFLGTPGLRLIEQNGQDVERINRQDQRLQLSFANESQYLMVNLASVKWLTDRVREKEDISFTEGLQSTALRFRPNLVVDFREPFIENELESIDINSLSFKALGSCTRCQMICINQDTAKKTKEPLVTLSRAFEGKVKFGVYLANEGTFGDENMLVLESEVLAKMKI